MALLTDWLSSLRLSVAVMTHSWIEESKICSVMLVVFWRRLGLKSSQDLSHFSKVEVGNCFKSREMLIALATTKSGAAKRRNH